MNELPSDPADPEALAASYDARSTSLKRVAAEVTDPRNRALWQSAAEDAAKIAANIRKDNGLASSA